MILSAESQQKTTATRGHPTLGYAPTMGRVPGAIRLSSCITVVVLQHSAQSFATLDLTDNLAHAFFRIDQPVVETLMVALFVVVRYEFGDRPAE